MKKLILLVMVIVAGCAAQPKRSTLLDLSPEAARCLGAALNSGAYDVPPEGCR